MPESEATKRFRARHRRLGLCGRCSRKAEMGLLHCRVCLARMSERRMARHPKFCPECGKLIRPEERTGRNFHRRCAQKRIARMHPPVHRRAAVAYQKRHRQLGLCTSCPRKVFKSGLCRKHYKMKQERYYERAAG